MSANTIITSVVTGGTNSHATTAEEANALATDFVSAGVVGSIGLNTGSGGTGSFCVNADTSPDMGITIKSGQAYISATPSGQNAQILRARASTDYTAYTINANSSGSTKYDWIYLKVDATNSNTPSADASNVSSIYTSRSSSNNTDNGSPPTYGLLLAVVTVANGASSITNGNISDRRTQASISISGTSNATGWTALTGYTPSSVTYNGNRSYSLVFSSVDLTGTLSAGMRLRTTRTSQAPTQCTSLNGSTQYYNKASPAGMTFTDDFVVSAWIKLSSYTSGAIASRYNGTSGWLFQVDSTGRVQLTGFNASSSNASNVTSAQSVPLNRWVHVAAQLDMSTFTATTTTSYVMIDGVDVPAVVARSGTNPTALVQPSADLQIGASNSGNFFPGKLAQVAVFSAKVTQSTIQGYISQGLSGSETSLISAYSFNNSLNDLNANANNLTANGAAVATNADSPFGGQADGTISSTLDYGIITKTAFSTNTTVTVQVPEGCTVPTTGGVSAVSYSSQKVPYLMPVDAGRWRIEMVLKNSQSQSSPTQGVWYNLSTQLNIPIGAWRAGYEASVANVNSSTTSVDGNITLSSGNNTDSDSNFRSYFQINAGSATLNIDGTASRHRHLSLSSQTTYYLNIAVINNGGGASVALQASKAPAIIEAELTYL